MSKPLVLIVGATGRTGHAISKAILREGRFRLAILVRQPSVEKTTIEELVSAGAELRIGDITESPEKLEADLQGVDILISTVLVFVDQKPLLDAAKKANVGRVIPGDFGPSAPKGVMMMHDMKLAIREYVKELGLTYTFVEAGCWMSAMFPYPHSEENTLLTPKYYVGNLDQKIISSTLPEVGTLVERIIGDERTLNKVVVAHTGEVTLRESWGVAEKITGEDFSDYYKASEQELASAISQNKNLIKKISSEIYNSVMIRGDNTLEKAEAAGALDARKLYPDVEPPHLVEEAKRFYENPPALDCRFSAEDLADVLKP